MPRDQRSEPRLRETSLYGPVKRYLETLGFTVKGEVCGCDLVALRGGEPPTIEAKPNLRWLMTSGTPGLTVNGDGLPKDITGQAELAWQHIIGILGKAGMTVTDIVKVTQYLTRADDIAAYANVRTRYLGQARPAAMLLVIPQLVWPEILVEVEIIAAKA